MSQKFVPDLLPDELGRLHSKVDGTVMQSVGDLQSQDIGVALCNIATLAASIKWPQSHSRIPADPHSESMQCCKVSLVYPEYTYNLTNHGNKFVYSKRPFVSGGN